MNNQSYVQLIKRFCEHVNIGDCESVLAQGSVAVGGIGFSLVPAGTPEHEELLVYCDFGELPQTRQQDALRRLLEINILLSSGVSPASFCVNPENGHVIFSYRALLAQTDAPALAGSLQSCVEQAREWRANHFLAHEVHTSDIQARGIDRTRL
ncbi:CesT family type III secretion system chaperone [Burkholderia diffusa]|uniref:CesT family type III secretion system chaperone n=1 Tax=Burkholderia diffusa TaxID=488732 RepID=UPI0009BDFB8D|nr:CesT family type III secretion system chaperone [Burkholderia diffusa]